MHVCTKFHQNRSSTFREIKYFRFLAPLSLGTLRRAPWLITPVQMIGKHRNSILNIFLVLADHTPKFVAKFRTGSPLRREPKNAPCLIFPVQIIGKNWNLDI
jgi:hypothetical protein